jgi:exopolysaccharide biosynthesis WecB/TagA/CpsF family protein
MSPAKVGVFGIGISVTNYEQARDAIIAAARERRSFAVSSLAVHGLMESVRDPELARLVNQIDLVTPDGQPVRWAINILHGAGLKDRVCGPELTAMVCEAAAQQGIGVFCFGSTAQTCERFAAALRDRYPNIRIVGIQSDRFREATPEEDREDVRRINDSGAGIVLVGRGCPRQERWVATHRGRIDGAMMAVGAAFDFLAGNVKRAPVWMQRTGLEWLYRLAMEPRRLWRRYLITNGIFLFLLMREWVRRRVFGSFGGLETR